MERGSTAIKPVSILGAHAFYNAGDQGCAYGPLNEIAGLMRYLSVGQTLEVRATDPNVTVDLPAWCRLTGQEFVTRQGDRLSNSPGRVSYKNDRRPGPLRALRLPSRFAY